MYNPYLPREAPDFIQPPGEPLSGAAGPLRGLDSLRGLLSRVHLDRLDSGDLLLLLVALLLWREGEEREFALALGLVLLLELFGGADE